MGREIKFRAFDKQDNNFFIPCLWEFNDMNSEIENLIYDGRYKLMQYVGLKDKNGIEIYEGDICTNEKFWDEPRQIGFNYLGTVCSIDRGKDERSFHIEILEGVKVIGNIYENKDLLND